MSGSNTSLPTLLAQADQAYTKLANVYGNSVGRLSQILPQLEELAAREVGPSAHDQGLANAALHFAVLVVRAAQAGIVRNELEKAIAEKR